MSQTYHSIYWVNRLLFYFITCCNTLYTFIGFVLQNWVMHSYLNATASILRIVEIMDVIPGAILQQTDVFHGHGRNSYTNACFLHTLIIFYDLFQNTCRTCWTTLYIRSLFGFRGTDPVISERKCIFSPRCMDNANNLNANE